MVDEDLNGQSAFGGMQKRAGPVGKFISLLKNLATMLALLLVVVASFWVSFQLGKRILVPVIKLPEGRIEAAVPEPPSAIQALQEPVAEKLEEPAVVPEVKKVKRPAVVKVAEAVRHYFKVQAGLYVDRGSARTLADQVKENGFDVFVRKVSEGWRVQVGAFRTKAEAENLQKALSIKGLKSQIIYE